MCGQPATQHQLYKKKSISKLEILINFVFDFCVQLHKKLDDTPRVAAGHIVKFIFYYACNLS
jgi:hypothetical protein